MCAPAFCAPCPVIDRRDGAGPRGVQRCCCERGSRLCTLKLWIALAAHPSPRQVVARRGRRASPSSPRSRSGLGRGTPRSRLCLVGPIPPLAVLPTPLPGVKPARPKNPRIGSLRTEVGPLFLILGSIYLRVVWWSVYTGESVADTPTHPHPPCPRSPLYSSKRIHPPTLDTHTPSPVRCFTPPLSKVSSVLL